MANTGNTQQQINYGAAVNDGAGDPLRTAFIKTDDNFDNVWLAGPVGSNITITNNTVQVNNTNGNLILSPNGTGVIQTNSRLLPRLNNTYDFGSTTLKYRTGYFGTGGLVIDGNVTVAGNLTAGNISYTGNVFVGDLQGSVYADDSTIMVDAVDNELFAGRATISGNVSATYFIGNGSQLTGIAANYSNTNVASYLTTYTGNIAAGNIAVTENIVVAGDVTAGVFYGTFAGNISGNLVVPGSNTWVLYNNNGNAGAENNFRYDSATDTMTVNGTANLVAINSTTISASGNITGAYVLGNGSALTAITGANVTGTVANAAYATSAGSAASAITVAGANVTGTVANAAYATSAGTVTTAAQPNITSVGTMVSLTATGNITGGNIATAGNVSGTYIFGNGSQLTGITAASTYGNANVAAYLPTYTGQLSGNQLNITRSGNAWSMIDGALNFPTGALWYSDISTNDEFISTNVDGYLNFQTFDSTSNVATELHMEHGLVHINIYNGTLKQWEFNEDGTTHFPGDLLPQANLGGNLGSSSFQWQDLWVSNNTIYINSVPLSLTAGNVLTVNGEAVLSNDSNSSITTTGNITANYFVGNGSQLTGLASTYGNANVANYLPTFSGNISAGNVSATGNVSGAYIKGNGSELTNLPAPTVTQDITSNGAMSIMTYDGVIKYVNYATVEPSSGNISAGNVSTTGNVSGNYFIGNGSQLTGIGAASTGNVTFNNVNIIGTGNLNLQPDSGNSEYLNIYLTAAADIHIAAAGAGPGNVILGTDEGSNVAVLWEGNVAIQAGNVSGTKTWNFDTTGNLTLPLNSVVYETNIPDGGLSGSAIALKPTGGTTANQQLLIYPTAADGDHIHMTSGNLYATELFLGSDNFYVKLANTGNVVVNSNDAAGNAAQWTFDTTGNLTLPGNTFAVNYANGTPVSISGGGASTGNVTFSDQIVIGTGDPYGGGGLYLAPGATEIGNLQYFRVSGGDNPTHLHFATGNVEYYDQYFGDDNKYLKLEAGYAGNIAIGTDDDAGNRYTWTFDSDGNLTVPGNIQTITTGFAFASNISNITLSDPVTVNLTDSPFPDPVTGQVTITGVVGTTEANGTWYFQADNPDEFHLYNDAALTSPVDGAGWTAYDSGGSAVSPGYSDLIITTGNVSIVTNDGLTLSFDAAGNLTLPGNIVGTGTILIDNRATGSSADIQLYSADDILLQARDRTAGSGSEGGDINIFAGDSAEDGDASAGDVEIRGGDGGAGNLDVGGSGGTITIRSGRGGNAVGNSGGTAESGGSLTLRSGDAGDNNGNADLGEAGGPVNITAGTSTGNLDVGGSINLTPGGGGLNAAAGNVYISIPNSDQGPGGDWIFSGTGNELIVPPDAAIYSPDAGNLTLATPGNIVLTTNSGDWTFSGTGQTVFPTLTVTRGDHTGTLTGSTILIGDGSQEALLSTPNGNNDAQDSQRLVINPGAGADGTAGEGGDIYLYAGRGGSGDAGNAVTGGSGGDIKIRGGLSGPDNDGGYIDIVGGEANGNGAGGNIDIQGGLSGNLVGGNINIDGGQGATNGGAVIIQGGLGIANSGGAVSIVGGIGNGLAKYGNVSVAAGTSTWTFDNTGTLTVPTVPWTYMPVIFTSIPVTFGETQLTFTVLPDNAITNMSVAVGAGGYGPDSVNLTIPGTTFPGGTSPANDIVFNVQTFESAGPVYSTQTNSAVAYVSGNPPARYDNITNAGNVGIGAGSSHWTFTGNGNLTLPQGGAISEGLSPSGLGNTIALTPAGGGNVDQQLLVYPTGGEGNHLHLTSGNLYNTELYLGNDNFYVKLANTGNVVINSYNAVGNSAQWTFDTTGNLTLPGNIFAVNYANGDSATTSIVNGASTVTIPVTDGDVVITANASAVYTFTTAGDLALPNDLTIGTSGGAVNITARDDVNISTYGNVTIQSADGAPGSINFFGSGGDWTGQPVNNLSTATSGGGTGLTVNVTESGGVATGATIATPGTGYTDGDFVTVNSGTGSATLSVNVPAGSTWTFDTEGSVTLPTISLGTGLDEQTVVQSQRKIIPPFRYSVEITGNAATVVYTASSSDITSMKVTTQIQHQNLGMEFFEVFATESGNNTYYTVNNRLAPPGITASTVLVDINGSNEMQITVTITSGAATSWVTYDAVEFGIPQD